MPFRCVADGVAVRVRVTPKARRDRIDGLCELADGAVAVKAAVTAAPEGGRANAALLRLLARTWRLPRTALDVTAGAGGRLKTVTIRGDGQALADMLEAWRTGIDTQGGKDRA